MQEGPREVCGGIVAEWNATETDKTGQNKASLRHQSKKRPTIAWQRFRAE
jgi:hypothetical protein